MKRLLNVLDTRGRSPSGRNTRGGGGKHRPKRRPPAGHLIDPRRAGVGFPSERQVAQVGHETTGAHPRPISSRSRRPRATTIYLPDAGSRALPAPQGCEKNKSSRASRTTFLSSGPTNPDPLLLRQPLEARPLMRCRARLRIQGEIIRSARYSSPPPPAVQGPGTDGDRLSRGAVERSKLMHCCVCSVAALPWNDKSLSSG